MKVVLSTEDINSYGFWVLTSGVMLGRFKKNPVVTLNHDKWNMSVGKINNVRIEDGQLVGEVEFDEGDEKGKELKRKYEKGYMNGFSVGIRVLSWSEDQEHIKKGQTRATVVKSELMEIAAATVPSNSSAVRLYDADGEILSLSAGSLENLIPEIKSENNMKEIALSLGLPESASEKEISAKIAELKAEKQEAKADTDKTGTEKLKAMFIGLGTAKGVITDDTKEHFEKLFAQDPDLAIETVNLMAGQKQEKEKEVKTQAPEVTLSGLLEKIGKGGTPEKEITWETLSDKDKIKLRDEKPGEYKKLYAAYYGTKPDLTD